MMHRNKPAVTLIETLISLTIVGIALIALLPVVTVKKSSTVSDYGNMYWDSTKTMTTTNPPNLKYLCPASTIPSNNLSIGAGDTEPIKSIAGVPAANTNFTIFNQGLGNTDNFPLSVTNLLTWNGTTINSSNQNTLFIGNEPTTEIANAIAYKNNLYINSDGGANTFILEQNTNSTPLLRQTAASLEADFNADGFNDINNLYTIRLEDAEYMHIDQNAPNTHIGIGKNAVRNYTLANDIIAIANTFTGHSFVLNCITGAASVPAGMEPCLNTDLVIGSKAKTAAPLDNDYNKVTDWVIHHERNNNMFTINAPVVQFNLIKVAKVVLPSDRRLKTILSQYKKGLKELLKIKPVEFVYKKDEKKEHHIGVIAQDLRKVFPEAVEINPQTGYLMVGTDPIFYAMINAIKELHIKNQELKKQNDELEQKVIKLRKIRDELKNKNESLSSQPSLRGSRATEAISLNKVDSCNEIATPTSRLAMTKTTVIATPLPSLRGSKATEAISEIS